MRSTGWREGSGRSALATGACLLAVALGLAAPALALADDEGAGPAAPVAEARDVAAPRAREAAAADQPVAAVEPVPAEAAVSADFAEAAPSMPGTSEPVGLSAAASDPQPPSEPGAAPAAPPGEPAAAPAPQRLRVRQDPFEPLNRRIFTFNEAVDRALLQPVARVYREAVPELVRTGVRNVFGNVEDAWSAVNHLLQGKGRDAYEMTVRFITNSTFGLGGLLDVAGEMGLERRSEDFGQTLGRWGVPAGPYLVLPFLGASSLRDTAGLRLDRAASLPAVIGHERTRLTATAVEVVQARSGLLQAGDLLGQVALDRYTFVREAYLARRRSLVYDGNPPEEPEDDAPATPAPR